MLSIQSHAQSPEDLHRNLLIEKKINITVSKHLLCLKNLDTVSNNDNNNVIYSTDITFLGSLKKINTQPKKSFSEVFAIP